MMTRSTNLGLTQRRKGNSNNRGGSSDNMSSSSTHSDTSQRSNGSRERRFWGQPARWRGPLPIESMHSHDTNSIDSVGSQEIASSAGKSSMYTLFTTEIEDMICTESVKRVLKLMFSSLAVVFQETKISSDGHPEESPFKYTRIPSIPAPAARMLWSELMGGVSSELGPEGYLNMHLLKHHASDPGISQAVVEHFSYFVNCGHIPFKQKKKEMGFWGKIRQNKVNQDEDEPPPRRRYSKDPFLYFIRDTLMEMGYLEVTGRRVDDDEEEGTDEDEDDDDDHKYYNHHNQHKPAVLYDGDGGDLPEGKDHDETVDFTGWVDRKQKIRAQQRTQYFQIYQDMQFQFGVYLSGVPVTDGGFSVLKSDEAFCDRCASAALREHDTMRRWNDSMANACAKQLSLVGVVEKRGAERLETHVDLLASHKCNPFDEAASYAIQMYPSHLMRSGRVVEAARILMSPKFFQARCCCLQSFEAANRHRVNLEEMTKRCSLAAEGRVDLGGDGSSIDPTDITVAAVNMIVKTMKDQYPILMGLDETSDQHVRGESEAGDVGRALHLIASFLGDRGQVKTSMEIYELCLQYKIAALGRDHSSVARTLRHMGHQQMSLFEYDAAVDSYSEAIRIERLQEELQYKHIILGLNSMAMIYGMTGRPKLAINSYSQSLVIQKVQFGGNDLQVAETLNSMGIVYGMMCEFESAIECYSKSLYIKIRKLGKNHEDVADLYFNLGLVHNKLGDHEAAINDYQEALRIRKEQFGEEHEDVARVLHHIGVVLCEMGEVADAQRFYEECLRIRRLVLGDEHEDVARTLHNLGLVYYECATYDKALACLEDAVELGKKRVGRRSEKVADTLHAIGMVQQKLANFKEAIYKYEDAVKIRRTRLGDDHLEVASTLHNMGDVYYMMGDLDMAMTTYEEAYDIRVEKLGSFHLDVAATRNNMGVVLMKQGHHESAMECFSSALEVREEKLGPDHEKCSDTLHNMGLVHKNLKQYAEAIERYEQALRVRRIQLGENDMKVADTLYNMAIVYANTNQYANALERYKEALRTYRETGMSDDHPSVVNTLQWIKWAQKKLSKASSRRNLSPTR